MRSSGKLASIYSMLLIRFLLDIIMVAFNKKLNGKKPVNLFNGLITITTAQTAKKTLGRSFLPTAGATVKAFSLISAGPYVMVQKSFRIALFLYVNMKEISVQAKVYRCLTSLY